MLRRRYNLTESDIQHATAAAECVVTMHERLTEFLRIGQTLAEVDAFVGKTLDDLKCKSCFKGYRPHPMPAFPSHACLSLNECVVHGTAGYLTRPIEEGDVLKIDIGVTHKGWIGDAAHTYCIGSMTEDVARLTACGREALRRGVQALQPGEILLKWAQVVQPFVEHSPAKGGCGFHLIRGLGGHGYGKKLHAEPYIANVVPSYAGEWPDAFTRCEVGMLLAVEPMISIGTGQTRQERRKWPVYTADGSQSVHYEHDVLITEDGPRVLTAGLENLPDVVG